MHAFVYVIMCWDRKILADNISLAIYDVTLNVASDYRARGL